MDPAEDPDLMQLFENLPDTEMSLADAMQFNDSSLSDAAARSQFVYLPEESQHSLADVLDIQPGQGLGAQEGFAQLQGVAGFGRQDELLLREQVRAEDTFTTWSFSDLFPLTLKYQSVRWKNLIRCAA
jgi:hypothetical protein